MRIGDYIIKTESSEEKAKLEGFLKWHNFTHDEKFENKKEGFDVFVVNIIHKSYFEIAYFDVGCNRMSLDEFFKRIHYDDTYWLIETFADDDVLLYRGYVDGDNRPYGIGTVYYQDGKIFQEGLFDFKGLIEGKEYYPNGKLHFEGVWYITTGYGPNAPKCGNLYDETGELIFTGKFEIRTGGVGYPMIRYPRRFNRIPDGKRPKFTPSRNYVRKDDKMNLRAKLVVCEELYAMGDYNDLIETCDEILEEFPDNQNALGYKGFSYYALGDYDETKKILENGVGRYLKNYYLKNNLAMVYFALGDYETSLTLCEEGLEIKDFDWLCENKFKNLVRLGRYDEAFEFEKSIKPDFPWILKFLDDDTTQHELDYCHYLLEKNPDDVFVKNIMGMIS
ncbi:MAG: tetratricopeptide repeat protein [Methanobrevibacter sp.]|nr:tetratricopeptide repeat protein [Methanobrevibacter sp.]